LAKRTTISPESVSRTGFVRSTQHPADAVLERL